MALVLSTKGAKTEFVVSPADVTRALDAFNRGFDECRIFIEFLTRNPDNAFARGRYRPTFAGTVDITDAGIEFGTYTTVSATAYPNPFREKVNIEVISPVDTKAKLEIYSPMGERVNTLYDGELAANKIYTFEFTPRNGGNVFLYKLSTPIGIQSGKLLCK
jgi:hypothetical protein